MKDFNIFIDKPFGGGDGYSVKTYDVYLGDRIKEYKVVVSSFKFKEILSYADRLVLSSCIEFCTLQTIIKDNSGIVSTEIGAKLQELLEECFFLLNSKTEVRTEAEFKQEKLSKLQENVLEISSSMEPLLGIAIIEPHSIVELDVAPIAPNGAQKKMFSDGTSAICTRVQNLSISEQNFLTIHPDAIRIKSKVELVNGYSVVPNENSTVLNASIQKITETVSESIANAVDMFVYPLEAGIATSLGQWNAVINIGRPEASFWEETFEAFQNIVSPSYTVNSSLKVGMQLDINQVLFDAKVEQVSKRVHNRVVSAINLAPSIIKTEITHSLGRWLNLIGLNVHLGEMAEEVMAGGITESKLSNLIEEVLEESYIQWTHKANLSASVAKLLAVIGAGSEILSFITSGISDVRLDLSAGRMDNTVNLKSNVEESLEKAISVQSSIDLLCEIKTDFISEFGVNSGISLNLDMSALTKRYAMLNDYDEKTLEESDDFSLADLDYIVLEG